MSSRQQSKQYSTEDIDWCICETKHTMEHRNINYTDPRPSARMYISIRGILLTYSLQHFSSLTQYRIVSQKLKLSSINVACNTNITFFVYSI